MWTDRRIELRASATGSNHSPAIEARRASLSGEGEQANTCEQQSSTHAFLLFSYSFILS
jgi:hypothetical protein